MAATNAPTVFVVDDDPAIRETLESLLRSVGLRMRGVGSTQEFLSCDRGHVPSCLVLDVRLPGTSGLEFHKKLRAAKDEIPVIFITGHGDIPMSVRAMKAGACEFLTKPFRDQDLLDAIQAALAKDGTRLKDLGALADLRQRFDSLTTREQQVMAILVTGQLNKQIGAMIGTTESTVKAHRMQIMKKMQAGTLTELVRMADKLQVVSADI